MRIASAICGVGLILLGVVGFFLPFVPGTLMILLGLAIVARESRWVQRLRHEWLFPVLDRFLKKIGWLIIVLCTGFASPLFASPIPDELGKSLEMRAQMNALAREYGLHRIKNVAHLELLVCAGAIMRVESPSDMPWFYLDRGSKGIQRYPYLRRWAYRMLEEITKEFFEERGVSPKIVSLARTIPYQKFLELNDKSDAKESSPYLRSAHPDANGLDISKRLANRLMNEEELDTMRRILAYWDQERMIDAIEERAGFHVTVSPFYAVFLEGEFITDDDLLEAKKEECAEKLSPPAKKKSPKKPAIKKKSPKRKR